MIDLISFFKKRKEGKLQKAEREIEAVRLAFTQRYLNFKSLLSINDKVLEIINELEQALQGHRGFGMSFVRANCTALSVNLYKIIQNLNAITANRYPELFEVFQEIWEKIDRELKNKKTLAEGELVLPLEAINRDRVGQVGGKMANLGEVKNRLGLPVPEGFVITTSAYDYFMESQPASGRNQPPDSSSWNLRRSAQLHETSSEIQKSIIGAPLPPELEEAIFSAYQQLINKTGRRPAFPCAAAPWEKMPRRPPLPGNTVPC